GGFAVAEDDVAEIALLDGAFHFARAGGEALLEDATEGDAVFPGRGDRDVALLELQIEGLFAEDVLGGLGGGDGLLAVQAAGGGRGHGANGSRIAARFDSICAGARSRIGDLKFETRDLRLEEPPPRPSPGVPGEGEMRTVDCRWTRMGADDTARARGGLKCG